MILIQNSNGSLEVSYGWWEVWLDSGTGDKLQVIHASLSNQIDFNKFPNVRTQPGKMPRTSRWMCNMKIRSSQLMFWWAIAAGPVLAGPTPGQMLSPVVVTATRVARPSMDLPVSVDRVGADELHTGQLQVNLSESLISVPGLSVQSRQNYAQDLQMSIRGFGARSSFGVRGVRLFSDGIPGTMPDGQGQFSQFDLGSAASIEVLRGPFSALYGNSSGGVIALFTEDGQPGNRIYASGAGGSLGTQRYSLKTSGDTGSVNYVVDAAHFQVDGYREHSAAERNNVNAKVRFTLSPGSELTLVANGVQTPAVQDPLGLTREQWEADPRQAGTNAITFNTRKSLSQGQVGATWRRKLGGSNELSITAYAGHRSTEQFQSIPVATQARPTHPGGVIDLGRDFRGADARISAQRSLAGFPLRVTAGLNYDEMSEARRGYLNFIGDQVGVKGDLRRDESNFIYDFDQYLQLEWDPGSRWHVLAGVRNSEVRLRSRNQLQLSGDPVSRVGYSAVNPVAGITFSLRPDLNLYAAYGRGFETPTLNELSYRSTDGSIPGMNFGLKPSRSDNFEVGLKARGTRWRTDLAAFQIRTRDELAVLYNSGGRSVYQNIGSTLRRGLEWSVDAELPKSLTARLALTHIRALVDQTYTTCAGLPCLPVQVEEGNQLPAVPENSLYAGLTWRHEPHGLTATLEVLGRSKMYTDDRNTDAAPAYWSANFRVGLEQQSARWKFSEFVRVDNLTDRSYVGSVIVNASNARFFEPAPGRTYYAMFTMSRRN